MDKRVLNHMMDWVAWKEDIRRWHEIMPYMFPEEEESPKYYPCVVVWDSDPCSVGSQRYDLYYQFIYLSDFNTMDKTKAMLGERTKLRNKILAAAKNNESRSNYNTLIVYCQEYLDLTNDLVMMGRRVSITSELLKVEYWRKRYQEFNDRNPNIVMGSDDKTYRWVVKVDDLPLYQMRGSEKEFRKVFDGIRAVMTYMNPMTPVTYVKLVK